jgi:hypothetical protein
MAARETTCFSDSAILEDHAISAIEDYCRLLLKQDVHRLRVPASVCDYTHVEGLAGVNVKRVGK